MNSGGVEKSNTAIHPKGKSIAAQRRYVGTVLVVRVVGIVVFNGLIGLIDKMAQ